MKLVSEHLRITMWSFFFKFGLIYNYLGLGEEQLQLLGHIGNARQSFHLFVGAPSSLKTNIRDERVCSTKTSECTALIPEHSSPHCVAE